MTTANFDKIDTKTYGGYGFIDSGYSGLNWDNLYVLNPALFEKNYPDEGLQGSGYDRGVTSGKQEAFTGGGEAGGFSSASGGTFTLKSVELTSAWNTKEKVDVQAFDVNGNLIHEKMVTIGDSGPTLAKFNWTDVSSVTFTPGKYMQDPNLTGSGAHIVFDDVKISDEVAGTAAVGTAAHSSHAPLAGSLFASHDVSAHPGLAHLSMAHTALL